MTTIRWAAWEGADYYEASLDGGKTWTLSEKPEIEVSEPGGYTLDIRAFNHSGRSGFAEVVRA